MAYKLPNRQLYPSSYYERKQPVKKIIDNRQFIAKRTGPPHSVVAVRGSTGYSYLPLPTKQPVRTQPRRQVRNCTTCGGRNRNVFCPNCA